MKNNLKIMKTILSQMKPLGFTYPDEELVSSLNAFSFIGSTISMTFMILGNQVILDILY